MHMGPPSLLPLSEKLRCLIHYPSFRGIPTTSAGNLIAHFFSYLHFIFHSIIMCENPQCHFCKKEPGLLMSESDAISSDHTPSIMIWTKSPQCSRGLSENNLQDKQHVSKFFAE